MGWERLRGLAEQFTENAHAALGRVTVWLYGSIARGDFNFWSDVDVLLVAEKLPDCPLERLEMLMQFAPPMVEPIGYTKEEFECLLAKHHPNLIALLREAICLRDELGLTEQVRHFESIGGALQAAKEESAHQEMHHPRTIGKIIVKNPPHGER